MFHNLRLQLGVRSSLEVKLIDVLIFIFRTIYCEEQHNWKV